MSRRWPRALLPASLTLVACGGPAAPVISPNLDQLEAGVRAPIEEVLQAVRSAPDDARLRGELAMLYQANGLGESVEAAYAQVMQMDPSEGRWPYFLAHFRRAQGDLHGAVQSCEAALALAPDYNPARRHLGTLLLELGEPQAALDAFEEARASEPGHVANLVGLGRAHLQLRDWRAAADLLEKVVEEQPRFGYAHGLLARAYQGLGDLERASLAACRGRGPAAPSFDPWMQELADCRAGYKGAMRLSERLFAQGDQDGAIRVLVKLREEYPDDPMLLSNLAAAYSRKGEVETMLAILRQAVETNPDHYPTHLNLSYGFLTKGDTELALKHAERAIELNSDQSAPFAQLAEIHLAQGDEEAALAALARAIELQGDILRYRIRRAELLMDAERYDEAIAAFEEISASHPSSVRAVHSLARTLAAAGNAAAAVEALEKARGIDPDHKKHGAIARALEEAEAGEDD